jgi:protein involved in polysaccharide export with SLBB domain
MLKVLISLLTLWSAWQAPPSDSLYRLQPGDAIDIRLFFNPELNESVAIRPDGRISLQLVGDVTAAGKTVPELTAEVEQLFTKEVKTPKVSIQIRGFASQKVFVTGEVVRPGAIALPGNMTVYEALSEAGGIKNTGDRNLVVLIRKGADGKPEGRKLLLSKKGELTADAGQRLSPFDVVVVPESKIARVDRWVDQHIRQLIPINASAGFTYLLQSTPGQAIPII